MAADSPAEKMLIKLLVHNKLMTMSQILRVVASSAGKSEKKLPEEIVERKFVDPAVMKKVVLAVRKKGHLFPLLCDQVTSNISEIKTPHS